MMKLLVLCYMFAAAAAIAPYYPYDVTQAPFGYSAQLLQPYYNYRGPLSLAPGQPANILAADGRPLDTLDVNLDRTAHFTAKALEHGTHTLKKRSVTRLAVAPGTMGFSSAVAAGNVGLIAPVIVSPYGVSASVAAGSNGLPGSIITNPFGITAPVAVGPNGITVAIATNPIGISAPIAVGSNGVSASIATNPVGISTSIAASPISVSASGVPVFRMF